MAGAPEVVHDPARVQADDIIAGRYRLLRPIGAGAMGTVWAARHELLGRDVALKLASTEKPDARALFLGEVKIVGALRHPNVVDIADAGEAGKDGLYLAMELLEGESLAARIARAPIGHEEALAITIDICRGLAAAHAAGVVHRDVKPENVFLARGASGGVVTKLLDFGVSSIRGAGSSGGARLYGTPAYMSPEQALGESDVDQSVDLWAVGVVLYEMLAGRRPFVAESYPALLPMIIDAPHPPLPAGIPASAAAIVDRCLAKRREDRFAHAEAIAAAARDAIGRDFEAIERVAEPRGSGAPATPTASTRRAAIGAAIAGAVIAAATAIAVTRRGAAPSSAVEGTASASAISSASAGPSAEATVAASAGSAPNAVGSTTAAPATRASSEPRSKGDTRPRPAAKGRVTKVDSAGF